MAFARHWRHLLAGYLEGHKEVDGVMVRYEDLTGGRIDLAQLAASIGIRSIDPSPLERRISSTTTGQKRPKPVLSAYDRAVITAIGGRLVKDLGYR